MAAENLDIEQPEQLVTYLRETGRIGADELPGVTVLAGGVSNRTVLVEREREAWVLKQALAKLRVKVDWFSDPARVHREALGLKYLESLAPPGSVTPLIFEDPRNHVLAMAAVPRPHENWKTMLLAGRVEADHVNQFADLLAAIHRRSHQRSAELARVFNDRSFFASLRAEPYYAYTAVQVPWAARFLHDLIAATQTRRQALVHGDFSPKNILVHGGRLVLLDHEVIHWGDPAFDVGFSMTHLLSKAHHLPEHRAALSAAAKSYWARYLSQTRELFADLETMAVRHTLACLLARVRGRSPLEYLDETERKHQADIVVSLMRHTPGSMEALVDSFIGGL